MIDPQELFINQKVEAALRAIMNNVGRYYHFSKQRCTSHHRGEIYARTRNVLTLTGVAFEEKRDGFNGTYKIRVPRIENK